MHAVSHQVVMARQEGHANHLSSNICLAQPQSLIEVLMHAVSHQVVMARQDRSRNSLSTNIWHCAVAGVPEGDALHAAERAQHEHAEPERAAAQGAGPACEPGARLDDAGRAHALQ